MSECQRLTAQAQAKGDGQDLLLAKSLLALAQDDMHYFFL